MSAASVRSIGLASQVAPDSDIHKTGGSERIPSLVPVAKEDDYQVVLDPEDDPKNLPLYTKWTIILTISSSAACIACASTMAIFAEPAVMRDFHIPQIVATLAISLYVLGLAIGPLLLGPLSEVVGRNITYRVSFFTFFVFSWPVAFAPNTAVYLIFRFLTGFCGSTFQSICPASIRDVFIDAQVTTPVAIYSLGPFAGPVLGPIISGFINQHLNWRWTYRLLIIWSFTQFVLLCFLPETYYPVILKRKAQRQRKSTGDNNYYAPIEKQQRSLVQATLISCYKPFQLIFYEKLALLLNLWTALILGILYGSFLAYPVIFGQIHGFDLQSVGLSFLGMGSGMVITVFVTVATPLRRRMDARSAAKYEGRPPPEVTLVPGQIGAVLLPISLFWIAFTTYREVYWIVPVIASIPFGMGMMLTFISTLGYLVTIYRPIAASALASNSFIRYLFAAGFPLFAPAMYNRLGTVGATALFAGLTTITAPLPFVFYRIGARLRKNSRFAGKEKAHS